MKVRNLYLKQLKTASEIFCCRLKSYVKDKKKITFIQQVFFFLLFTKNHKVPQTEKRCLIKNLIKTWQ